MCTKDSDVARMRVRSTRLSEVVVAVVPHHDEAEVVDRCPDGAASSDGATYLSTREPQEAAIALRRSQVGRQRNVLPFAEHTSERCIDTGDVAMIRHDDDDAAIGCQRCGCKICNKTWPVAREH